MDALLQKSESVTHASLVFAKNKVVPDDADVILFTSGTTSAPKAVVSTHCARLNNALATARAIGATQKDRFCVALPMQHCFCLPASVLAAPVCGTCICFTSDHHSRNILDTIARHTKGGNRMKITKQHVRRVGIYVLGLFILAWGVAFAANANLGMSPVNSLPYVLSLVFAVPMSSCVIAVFSFYILLQIVLLRRQFKWINLTQILFSTIFGYFVDATKYLLGSFFIPTYFGSLLMLVISIVCIATGIYLSVSVKLVPMPMEGLTLALAGLQKKLPFHTVKIIVDCAAVLLAVVVSLIGLSGKVVGVREGTIISALAAGKVIGFLQKACSPILEKICFAPAQETEPRVV